MSFVTLKTIREQSRVKLVIVCHYVTVNVSYSVSITHPLFRGDNIIQLKEYLTAAGPCFLSRKQFTGSPRGLHTSEDQPW